MVSVASATRGAGHSSRRFATPDVPHLAELDLVPGSPLPAGRARLRGKQPWAPDAGRSYELSWRWYIRGHVVSQHAKRIIVQFMAACCGKSKSDRQPTAQLEEEG